MWLDLPSFWIAILNVVFVPTIHLGISWLCTRMPASAFRPNSWLFRTRPIEQGGALYQTLFAVSKWKHHLPDAARLVGGEAKRTLAERDAGYFDRFVVETCRGEAAHWGQLVALLLTLIWNPWPYAAIFMILYALCGNLPCIIVQRYNRPRLARARDRRR